MTARPHPRQPADLSTENLATLEMRRLFLLAPQVHPAFTDPPATPLGDWQLSHHRDLQVLQSRRGSRTLTLIGHLLDPQLPQADDLQLLEALNHSAGRLRDLPAATARFGGRWALIADDGEQALVWNDAAGQRSVFYHLHPHPHPHLGSLQRSHPASPQPSPHPNPFLPPETGAPDPAPLRTLIAGEPGLLASHLGLPIDPAAADFACSRGKGDLEVHWLPGDRTLYAELRALLPNHCLDLRSGRCWRFWPQAAIAPMDWEAVLQRSEALLRGQFEAARRRWPLALSMTAGWDSRLMLALCRPAAAQLQAFTLAYPPQGSDAGDVRVPARLLARLGLPHQIVHCPARVHTHFRALMRRHQPTPAQGCCSDVQALWQQWRRQSMCLSGDAAEIVKAHFRRPGLTDESLTAQDLAELLRIGQHPFALQALQEWLDAARPSPVPLLDLLCWEQMAGRWQAKLRADFDLVQDCIAPLNHRELLVTMLAADESRRRAPRVELFEALIRRIWPAVLAEPVNPPERQSLRRRLLQAVGRSRWTRPLPAACRRWARALLGRTP